MSTALAVGIIAAVAVIVSAVIGAGVSLLSTRLAQKAADKAAKEERDAARAADQDRRLFEARERRLSFRLEAAIKLYEDAVAINMHVRGIFSQSNLGDLQRQLVADLGRVQLICPPEVAKAGSELAKSCSKKAEDTVGKFTSYRQVCAEAFGEAQLVKSPETPI